MNMEPQTDATSPSHVPFPNLDGTEVILPAPPEIEIFTTDGKRDDMDNYVQDFGAYKHGYNIRKGNSYTGLICHYHCHRGGYPPVVEGRTKPTRSLRIGCQFKLTARINQEKKTWSLIHIHLGHNHQPDHTVKPRKRQLKPNPSKTQPKPIHTLEPDTTSTTLEPHTTTNHSDNTHSNSNKPGQDLPSALPSCEIESSTPRDHHTRLAQHHNNNSIQATISHVSARLETMSPTTRQKKIEQINCIINEPSISGLEGNVSQMPKSPDVAPEIMAEERTVSVFNVYIFNQAKFCWFQSSFQIDQMIEDFLAPFSDHDSQENSQIQVALDLIPVAVTPLKQLEHFQPLSPPCLNAKEKSINAIEDPSTKADPILSGTPDHNTMLTDTDLNSKHPTVSNPTLSLIPRPKVSEEIGVNQQ